MTTLVSLTESEFLEIEDALAATARGRAFLRMRDQHQRAVATSEVHRLAASMKTWILRRDEGAGSETHIAILRRELQEMGAYIEKTRRELASLRARSSGDTAPSGSRIDMATGELDEIVRSTERATSEILNAAERILEIAGRLPDSAAADRDDLGSQATEILTACSFQDLTGQRITRVVNTLRYLEQRVNAMIEIWGADGDTKLVPESPDARPDAHLLNGPARAGQGKSQAEIDAILNGVAGESGRSLLEAPADPTSAKSPPGPSAASPGTAASQADVDRLFG